MPTFVIETETHAAAERLAAAARDAGHRVLRWSPGDAIPRVSDTIFIGSLGACEAMPGVIGDLYGCDVAAVVAALAGRSPS